MIEANYNKTVAVKRLASDEGTVKTYATHIASLRCHIQPLDPDITTDIEGGFGKDWLLFCPVADIAEGDRIVDGDDEYRVTGVERFEFMGNNHLEVTIRIFES